MKGGDYFKWHDRNKVLPEIHQHVLVFTVNKVTMSAEFITNRDGEPCWLHFIGIIANEDVTHWHPYPQPPKCE